MDIYVNTPTFEKLREGLKWMIAEAREVIEGPDGDWEPFLFVENDLTVVPRSLTEFVVETDEQKDYVAEVVIPEMVREARGHRAGLTFPALIAAKPANDHTRDRYGAEVRYHEAVTLLVVDREHCELWLAPVERYPDRGPTLGPWFQLPAGAERRFVEPLRRAVCPQG